MDGASSGSAAIDAPQALLLPALQVLDLSNDCFIGERDIAALELPQLTKLSLDGLMAPDHMTAGTNVRKQFRTVVELLARLPKLSTLVLGSLYALGDDLPPISTMQCLQSCSLEGGSAVRVLQALSAPHLTQLRLDARNKVLSTSVLPASGWPELLQLSLVDVALQPAVLARLPQLQCLELQKVTLLPADVEDLRAYEVGAPLGRVAGRLDCFRAVDCPADSLHMLAATPCRACCTFSVQ